MSLKLILLAVGSWVFLGCGVRGDPQPPLNPPNLGRGTPTFSKATESIKLKKKKKDAPADDWDESGDFSESEEK